MSAPGQRRQQNTMGFDGLHQLPADQAQPRPPSLTPKRFYTRHRDPSLINNNNDDDNTLMIK